MAEGSVGVEMSGLSHRTVWKLLKSVVVSLAKKMEPSLKATLRRGHANEHYAI